MTTAEILATIPFPDPREEARARATEFQRLSPDERARQLAGMFATGMFLIQQSSHRAMIDRLFQAREAEWQRVQRDLFLRRGA